MEKIIRRHSDLIQIKENAKLLLSMLKEYSPDVTTLPEKEIMRQLFESCEQHRPRVFKLAAEVAESNTETEDGPNLGAMPIFHPYIQAHKKSIFCLSNVAKNYSNCGIWFSSADVLTTSDELTEAIQKYRAVGLATERMGSAGKDGDSQPAASSKHFTLVELLKTHFQMQIIFFRHHFFFRIFNSKPIFLMEENSVNKVSCGF